MMVLTVGSHVAATPNAYNSSPLVQEVGENFTPFSGPTGTYYMNKRKGSQRKTSRCFLL